MKAMLKSTAEKIIGMHDDICGDVSGISGDVSAIRGDVSGIRGDLDACELTVEDRTRGIDIHQLVG